MRRLRRAARVMLVALDYETTSPRRAGKFAVHEARIVGYSLSKQGGEAVYIPEPPTQALFQQPGIEWVAHNAKFEYIQTARLGIEPPLFHCTKLMAYLLQYTSTSLKPLTKQVLGIDPITYQEVTGGRSMADLTAEEILDYGASDSDHTIRLFPIFKAALEEQGLWGLYNDVERLLLPILARAEMRGVCLDIDAAQWAAGVFQRAVREAAERARSVGLAYPSEYANGNRINIGSTDQLGAWLDWAGAPIHERTEKKDLPKTDFATLLGIRGWNPPVIDAILDYKEKQKLASFPISFLELAPDGVIHTNINQAGHHESDLTEIAGESPTTGRLSASTPNLMQIPHHGRGKGKEYEIYGAWIRQSLVARPGYVLLAADVSQQEPRITAVIAPEPRMAEDFANGVPVYAPLGELIYGYAIGKNTHEPEWHTAKTFFLAFVYGCQWTKLLEIDPTMSPAVARQGYGAVAARYRGLPLFGDRVKLEIHEHGFATGYFGRRRYFPAIYSNDKRDREAAVRQAINFEIQGPAADLIKMAIRRNQEAIDEQDIDAHFLLPIHDEVIYEVRRAEVDKFLPIVYNMLDGFMPIEFPIEVKVGPTIADLRRI